MITIYYSYYESVERKQKSRREHQIGRSLLSLGISELYGLSIAPEAIDGQLSTNEYGKPYFPGHPKIHFNISHCDGLVACGFCEGALGLDVEDIAPFRETIFRKTLTSTEQEFLQQFRENQTLYQEYFYRFWTLKESRIKQAGVGLAMPMTDFSFQLTPSHAPAQIQCSQESLYFYQKKMDPCRILAICSEAPIPAPAFRNVMDPISASPSRAF